MDSVRYNRESSLEAKHESGKLCAIASNAATVLCDAVDDHFSSMQRPFAYRFKTIPLVTVVSFRPTVKYGMFILRVIIIEDSLFRGNAYLLRAVVSIGLGTKL